MTLDKTQFETILLLYAASIDGQLHDKEEKLIMKKIDEENYEKTEELFRNMSDIEILNCINENRRKYAATPEEKQNLLSDLKAVIEADKELTSMENYVFKNIEKLLNMK